MKSAKKISKFEHQLLLEQLYDKNQLFPRIREAFSQSQQIDFKSIFKEHQIPEKFGLDLLAQMAVRKRAEPSVLIGVLRHHTGDSQETAALLERAVEANLVDYYCREERFVVVYEISSRLQEELDRFQYPLPMVVPPREIKCNLDSGYLTRKASVILADNYHEEDVCLDHLNRMNAIPLSLDLDVAETIQNRWRNLDRKKPDEDWDSYRARKKAFEKYNRISRNVFEILLQEGNRIYLTHRYDKRGRTYCMGFHVSYQGNDWNKAIIQFFHKEKLDDQGEE